MCAKFASLQISSLGEAGGGGGGGRGRRRACSNVSGI